MGLKCGGFENVQDRLMEKQMQVRIDYVKGDGLWM
jgi:hypothetical protein